MLPTKRTEKEIDFHKLIGTLYSAPKCGKTTFAANYPDALFIATEPGQKFHEVYKVDCPSWEVFLEAARDLLTTKHEYKTVIIDIVDILWKQCELYICKKNKVDHPSDLAYGKGFSAVKDEFGKVIGALASSGFGILFLSHAKEKEMKTKSASWTMMSSSLPQSAEAYVFGLSDYIFYAHVNEKNERVIKTKAEKYINCGMRGFDLPNNIKLDYKTVIEEIKKQTPTKQKEEGK